MFVDRVEVELMAGNGGNGCMAFRREKHVPRGGPCGGDGGSGGSVIIRAESGVNSLVEFAHQRQWRAEPGGPGLGKDCHGRNGQDLILRVPPGTVLIDKETGIILRDLDVAGAEVVGARGGRGGWGNTHFKSAQNQAPRETTSGGEGERRRVILELKSIADVGLVGSRTLARVRFLVGFHELVPKLQTTPSPPSFRILA